MVETLTGADSLDLSQTSRLSTWEGLMCMKGFQGKTAVFCYGARPISP